MPRPFFPLQGGLLAAVLLLGSTAFAADAPA